MKTAMITPGIANKYQLRLPVIVPKRRPPATKPKTSKTEVFLRGLVKPMKATKNQIKSVSNDMLAFG